MSEVVWGGVKFRVRSPTRELPI